jgi:hypothetical protein
MFISSCQAGQNVPHWVCQPLSWRSTYSVRPNTDYSRSASVIWPITERIPMGRTRAVPFGARVGSTRTNVCRGAFYFGTTLQPGHVGTFRASAERLACRAGANPTSENTPWS